MNQNLVQKILNQNKATYEAIAEKFSQTRHRQWPIALSLVEKYIQPGQKVLDVGCGNGRLYQILEDKQVSYLGVDNSAKLIAVAKQTGGDFQVKDILNLDFKQEYDIIFALALVSHMPSAELRLRVLKNIYEALKPGGLLIMTCWNFWRWSRRHKTIWRYKIFERRKGLKGLKVKRLKGLGIKDIMTYFTVNDNKYPLYYYAFTLGGLKRLAKSAGLEIIEGYYEKDGQKSNWQQGKNLVLVCKKK